MVPLKEIQTKCIHCGAPTQWKKSVLVNRCEFCGLPVSRVSQYLGGVSGLFVPFKQTFSRIPIPTKEKIKEKGRILLKKQRILSQDQIEFIGKNINRVLSKRRNVVLIFAIPIGLVTFLKLYFRINYPQTAKPYYPDFPYRMPIPKETGKFVLYGTDDSKEAMDKLRFWCPRYRKNQTITDCLEENSQEKTYLDIGSEVRNGDWLVYKVGSSYRNNKPSNDANKRDIAINCKQGLISYYRNGGISEYNERKSMFPSQFGYEEKEQYERRKPAHIIRKMGKLWWQSGNVDSDLESGKYLNWHRKQVKEGKEWLAEVSNKNYCGFREGFKHKCTNKSRLESVNTARSLLKYNKQSLALMEYRRKENAISYNNLFKVVCKRGPFSLF